MNFTPQSGREEVTKMALISQPASFPSQPSAEMCTGNCYVSGRYGRERVDKAQLQLIVTFDDDQSAPSTKAMASSVAGEFGFR